MTKHIIIPLFSALFSTATMANVDAVTQCLNDYTDRYAAMEAEGEALPPMRNLYPEWEEDCNNGGELNKKEKLASSSEEDKNEDAKNAALSTGFQGKWIMQQDLNLNLAARLPVNTEWITITSVTDYKVHIQEVIINKGRCSPIYSPAYLLKPTTTVDYGQAFKVTGNGCAIHEATIVTDIGTTTITP